jgi:glycosyltransferase 2 family protein
MKRHLKNLGLPIKLFVSLFILAAIILRMDQDKRDILGDLASHFEASAWAYATLFLLAQFILLSFRWQMLLNIGKHHLGALETLQINLTSQLANLVFIASIGGMLARIALSVQHGASIFKTLIATVVDRLMTLSALIVLAAIFMPGLARHVDNQAFATFSTSLSILIVTLFIFTPLFLNFVVFRMPQVKNLKGRMRYGVRYLKILINNPLLLAKIVITSLAAQMGLFAAVYCFTLSSGADVSFIDLMTILPVISLIASLPISIGGWGVREGAFVYGLGLLGVPMETAFIISVQVGLIGMVATVLTGIPALMTANINMHRLSSLRETLAHIRIK